MVVVFDVGNTNIHIGLYRGRDLEQKWHFPVKKKMPIMKMRGILNDKRLQGVAIASVVPSLTKQIVRLCRQHELPVVVVSSKIDCGITYAYDNPATLGADRIAAVVGALTRYKCNVVVVDAGTAITIDLAMRDGRHLGGLIVPGMQMLSEIMHNKTAKLPEVSVRKPKNLVGRSTEECIQSGIFNGTMVMVTGLIKELQRQFGNDFFCVSTGGSGALVAKYVKDVRKYDGDLCLYGALAIYKRNVTD